MINILSIKPCFASNDAAPKIAWQIKGNLIARYPQNINISAEIAIY